MKFKKHQAVDAAATPHDVSSSSSVKTKKSTNFLSALVRRTRRERPRADDDAASVASQRLDAAPSDVSLLGIRIREEIEICGRYYDSESTDDSSCATSVVRHRDAATSLAPCPVHRQDPQPANGVRFAQDLTRRLREDEDRLVALIARFIRDPGVQGQLVEAVSQHAKFQREAERRTGALINEMWMQQLELEKAQSRTLRDNLNALTKQNRQLQLDNEVLFRRCEKALLRLKDGNKHKCADCESKLQEICQRNETLQHKLEDTYRAIDALDNETAMLRKRNEKLHDQLNVSSAQILQLEAAIRDAKTEKDLEAASLQQNLKRLEDVVGGATREGCLMLDELRRNVKLDEKDVDLSDPLEVVRLCRCGVSEACKEIVSLRAQLLVKDKDVDVLRETNAKLQENLMKSTSELDALSKRIEAERVVAKETDRVISDQQRQILEADLKAMKEKMEKMQVQFEMEKSALLNTISEYEVLNVDVVEKDRMLEQTRKFVCNVTSENVALRNQISSLLETGAGDVVRELRRCQEQLMFYQNQNNQLQQENNQMRSPEELQKYQMETEALRNENALVKQQLEAERRTVFTLQCERTKYLEEKKISRAIFTRIKTELLRAQNLENAMHDVTKQASKFALMAEHNKELGDRLKSELAEKDKTILMLKTSVEKLNDAQAQEAKEKLSLCQELSKLQVVKEQLSVQLQHNASRTQIEQTVKHQMKKLEEDKRSDRMIFSELASELKTIINQKESLIKEINAYREAVKKLRRDKDDHAKKIDEIAAAKNEMEYLLKAATARNEDSERTVKSLEEQLEKRNKKYQEDFASLKKLVTQLRKEKDELDSSVKYLQNTLQKIQKDLDHSRNNEEEIKRELDHRQNTVNSLTEENGKLALEVTHYNKLCEKILDNFESNMKSAAEKEELFKRELQESRNAIFECHRQIQTLHEQLSAKTGENQQLEAKFSELRQQHQTLSASYRSFEQAYRDLEASLGSMRDEHQELRKHFEAIVAEREGENSKLRDELERSARAREAVDERNSRLQSQLAELTARADDERHDLQQQVNILLDGMGDEKNRINVLNQEKEALQRRLDGLQARYSELLKKCVSMENDAKRQSLGGGHEDGSVDELRLTVDQLQQELTTCEFQKSELTLRLHEMQKKYETERSLCEQLRNTHKLVLVKVLRLKEEGTIDPGNCDQLIRMVQSGTETNIVDELDE